MGRPGTDVIIRELPSSRSIPTDTGTWFVCGPAEKGPLVPTLIQSLSEFVSIFGDRVSYSFLYDALDVFFKEGGKYAYVSRVVGDSAVASHCHFNDAEAAEAITVTANSVGVWGDSLKAQIVAGVGVDTFVIVVTDSSDVELERSPDLVDQAAAILWSASSKYVVVTHSTSANNPAVHAGVALAGGADDHAAADDDNWSDSLDKFEKSFGPGQVSMPGRTVEASQLLLLLHAQANQRIALVDLADSGDHDDLITDATALVGDNIGSEWAGAFAPWAIVPGVVAGTSRTVPYSAVAAGIIARNDATLSPNRAAAGEVAGKSLYATGLSQDRWIDDERTELNEAGVNVAISRLGTVMTYGFRTLADPVNAPNWLNLANSRLLMAIAAAGNEIMEEALFDQIDGRGLLFGRIAGELTAVCQGFYDEGSLYGATPGEAYKVNLGSDVNTSATIAAGEIHAEISVRTSPMAEWNVLELVKVPITQNI